MALRSPRRSARRSGRVHNDYGKVLAEQPGKPAVFSKVKQQLRTLVDFDKRVDRWSSWLSDAIKHADVQYAPRYQPAHPDAAPTGAQGGLPSQPSQPGR